MLYEVITGKQDAHERHLGEVVSLGNDLRAHEDVHFPAMHPGEHLLVESPLPAEVGIESCDPCLLPSLCGPRDQTLRADPDLRHLVPVAGPASLGRGLPRVAVVASYNFV